MNNKKQMPLLELRAWSPERNMMIVQGEKIVDGLLGEIPNTILLEFLDNLPSDYTIFTQFTNFKDTRSQKVFAGDIVSPMSYPEHERRYWEVKHEFGCFWINDAPIFDYAVYIDNVPTYQLEDLEVVGTIYTDKELLG